MIMKKSTKISLVLLTTLTLSMGGCVRKDNEWIERKNRPVTVHTNTNNKDSVGYYRHNHGGVSPFWIWYGMHLYNRNSYYYSNPSGYYRTPTSYSTVQTKTKSFSTVSGKTTSGPKSVTRSGFGTSFKSPSA